MSEQSALARLSYPSHIVAQFTMHYGGVHRFYADVAEWAALWCSDRSASGTPVAS